MRDLLMPSDRAVSEILGFVLVFALVVSTVTLVTVTGFGGLNDVRHFEQANNAERAFDVVAENTADVLLRGAPSRATEVKLVDAQLVTGDEVTINVTASNGAANPLIANATYSFKPIVYRGQGNSNIVYSGGAVFREDSSGGHVVRAPPYLLDSDRIQLPIPITRSRNDLSIGGSTVRLRTVAADEARLLDVFQTGTASNPPYEDISINVTSPRYELWKDYFEGQPATESCTTKETKSSVVCTLADSTATAPKIFSITIVRMNVEFEQ